MTALTKQEAFNKAYLGIIKQGKPSAVPNSDVDPATEVTCLYAGPDGCGCAIGQLVDRETAEAWDNSTKGSSIGTILLNPIPPNLDWMVSMGGMLTSIQRAHDQWANLEGEAFVGGYKSDMQDIAKRHGLTVPAI